MSDGTGNQRMCKNGHLVGPGDAFCPECAEPVARTCPNGHTVAATQPFCPQCGANVQGLDEGRRGSPRFKLELPERAPPWLSRRRTSSAIRPFVEVAAVLVALKLFLAWAYVPWLLWTVVHALIFFWGLIRLSEVTQRRVLALYGFAVLSVFFSSYVAWPIIGGAHSEVHMRFVADTAGTVSIALAGLLYLDPDARRSLRVGTIINRNSLQPLRAAVALGLVVLGIVSISENLTGNFAFGLRSSRPVAGSWEERFAQLAEQERNVSGKYLPPTPEHLVAYLREEERLEVPDADQVQIDQYQEMPDVPATDLYGNPTDMNPSHWFSVEYCQNGGLQSWDVNPYAEKGYQASLTIGVGGGSAC